MSGESLSITDAIKAVDLVNMLLQAEIEQAEPTVAIELAQIKLVVNRWFDERRRLNHG